MATKTQDKKSDPQEAEKAPTKKEDMEDPRDMRVDEAAWVIFTEHLGFPERLPDLLVEVYNDFKRTQDMLGSGRLSPEGFAAVVTIFKVRSRVG